MIFFRKFLKLIAPRSFKDGQFKCNELGKKLLVKNGVARFLDTGCSDGSLTIEFAKKMGAKEVYGVEFTEEYRGQAETRGIICHSWDLNGKWGFSDDYFDVILSSQIIEHLHNTRFYLEECFRCLKPGGQLIVLTENLASWVNIFSLVFGWMPFSTTNINGWNLGNPLIWHEGEAKDEDFLKKWGRSEASGVVGHVRVLAYKGLRDLLKMTGFNTVKIYSKGYLPFFGRISDVFCFLDRWHGHFLIATAQKPPIDQ
jgi:SAM-dependent methyltransferase